VIGALKKRAKTGDAEALRALVVLVDAKAPKTVTDATTAIGAVGTNDAWQALRAIIVEHANPAARSIALRTLSAALKRNGELLEVLLSICEDPKSDRDDGPMMSLVSAIDRDPDVAKEPRVIASLRRALDAENKEVQQCAVLGLITARDAGSLRSIMALGVPESSLEIFHLIGEAIIYLGGTSNDVGELRAAALQKGMAPDHVNEWMASLEKLIAKRDKKKKK
jgi:hypothetical protein